MSGNTLVRLISEPSPMYEELDQVATAMQRLSLEQNTVPDVHEILYCEREHVQVRLLLVYCYKEVAPPKNRYFPCLLL